MANEREPGDTVTLDDGQQATYLGEPPEGTVFPSTSASPIDLALGAFGFSTDEGRELLIRTGIIILGAALILIGVSMVISGSKTASAVRDTVVGTAVDLIPAGKVAKVAKKVL